MENFIHFFRDTLSGPSYIIYVIVLIILIFACIGYIAENKIKAKKEKDKYAEVAKPGEVVKSLEATAPIPVTNTPIEEVKPTLEPSSNQQIQTVPVDEKVVNSVPLQPITIQEQQIQSVQTVNPIPQVVQETAQTINPVPEQKTN